MINDISLKLLTNKSIIWQCFQDKKIVKKIVEKIVKKNYVLHIFVVQFFNLLQ